jgi:hypothetical protein
MALDRDDPRNRPAHNTRGLTTPPNALFGRELSIDRWHTIGVKRQRDEKLPLQPPWVLCPRRLQFGAFDPTLAA